LPELVIPRSLFFHFFIPPRYAQHQSLSESAISHLWFFLFLIVI
jgi:hypothetical protein